MDPQYPQQPPPGHDPRYQGYPSPSPYGQVQPQYGYQPHQPPPGPGYYPAPYPPLAYAPIKRTEFGWASIIVGGIALFLAWLPIISLFMMAATLALVLAGFLGRHERTTIPAFFGVGLLTLAAGVHVVSHVWAGLYTF